MRSSIVNTRIREGGNLVEPVVIYKLNPKNPERAEDVLRNRALVIHWTTTVESVIAGSMYMIHPQ